MALPASVMNAHYCQYCQNILLEPGSTNNLFQYIRRLDDFSADARKNCDFLAAVLKGAESFKGRIQISYYNDPERKAEGRVILDPGLLEPGTTVNLWSFYGLDDIALRHFKFSPLPNRDQGTAANIKVARGWLKQCIKDHKDCYASWQIQRMYPTAPPKRLLDISGSTMFKSLDKIRLTSATSNAEYAALSYCWGGDQPMKTTKTNLRDHEKGMRLSTLPKTIKDAVEFARGLGFKHLWIDSMCIVQDDADDVAQEISNLPNIFQGSTVTIGAATANSVYEGFLHVRRHLPAYKLRMRSPDGKLGNIVVQSRPDPRSLVDPINRRAWTLQELLLAPRVLFFGSSHFMWNCKTAPFVCENGDGRSDLLSLNTQPTLFGRSFDVSDQLWEVIIEDYTSRAMTYPKDKLVAISALAREILERLYCDDAYLAGLWGRLMPWGLLWYADSGHKPRPTEYRAPSWTWASVDGVIRWFSLKYLRYDATAKVLSKSVTLASQLSPCGAVTGGTLEVEGPMRPMLWARNGTDLVELSLPLIPSPRSIKIYKDTADHLPDDVVWLLQIGFCEKTFPDHVWALNYLILQESQDGTTYVRKGQLELWVRDKDAGWDDSFQQRVITIV